MSLVVKFYDVEHGSCTHVITPNGKHLLFDIGTKLSTSICRHLKNKYFGNSGKPDMLVITHPHIDHIADLENMYTYDIKPKCFWRDKRAFPLIILTSDRQAQISLKNCANRMSEEYSSAIGDLDDPETPENNGGVSVTRFTPVLEQSDYSDINNFSCINVIEYNGFKIVITGDNPSAKLINMLQQSTFKAKIAGATVLLAPHHGREKLLSSSLLAGVICTLAFVFDCLYTAELKKTLLCLGFTSLPGETVFTRISQGKINDMRFEIKDAQEKYRAIIGELPSNKKEKKKYENKNWYRLSLTHEDNPRVKTAHHDYLLGRDLYTTTITLSVLTVIGMGFRIVQFSWIPVIYLIAMLILTNIATRFRAHRFVNSVIAVDTNLQNKEKS